MVWTALQRYSTILIQFISGIILARLLTPHDYGCIGMLMIFLVLAESFIDGGFGSALIQKKRPTQEDYSTIFFWNLGMAVLLYTVLYLSAPAIARFYKIPLLCDVLRVQGIILFIYAFNVVQRNQLQKKLNFKVLSIVTITTSIISLIVTVVLLWAIGFIGQTSTSFPMDVYYMHDLGSYAILAGIIIYLYNGKRGHNSLAFRIITYTYFPLHLILLFLIFEFML